MSSRFRRSKQQRAERAPFTAHGSINLVPLVDILTSIVFFSLLTYSGAAMAALFAYDLTLPPVVITAEDAAKQRTNPELLNLVLGVRVDNDKMVVESSGNDPEGKRVGTSQTIKGLEATSLDTLQTVLTQFATKYPNNHDLTVIPSDDVNYDNVIHVLERARLATFTGIALGTKTRQVTTAAATGEVR
ncbi:MAG: biopolymer transporter ExbD [Gemmatimonadota bacterium]|nr:biopolymer transporter ExbD [Gemmatimonadota bacterium]